MSDKGRVLRVRITDRFSDPKVNLTIPLSLAKLATMGPIPGELKKHGIDVNELFDDLDDLEDGKIVDVIDENGEHVELLVETKQGDRKREEVEAGSA